MSDVVYEIEVCDECGRHVADGEHATSAHQNGPTHWERVVPEAEVERLRADLRTLSNAVVDVLRPDTEAARIARDNA